MKNSSLFLAVALLLTSLSATAYDFEQFKKSVRQVPEKAKPYTKAALDALQPHKDALIKIGLGSAGILLALSCADTSIAFLKDGPERPYEEDEYEDEQPVRRSFYHSHFDASSAASDAGSTSLVDSDHQATPVARVMVRRPSAATKMIRSIKRLVRSSTRFTKNSAKKGARFTLASANLALLVVSVGALLSGTYDLFMKEAKQIKKA